MSGNSSNRSEISLRTQDRSRCALSRPPWLPKFVLSVDSILVALLIGSGLLSCSRGGNSGTVETVTIGNRPNEVSSLLYVAEERGFFRANGLNIAFKKYDSGLAATSAALAGEVDLATSGEFVVVGNVFRKEDIKIIATIDKSQITYIVGRKDRGINSIADLRGKSIGVTRQTSDEFYLGRFLEINGMSIQEVNLVVVARAQVVDALVNGDIDAAAFIQPSINEAKQKLGEGVMVWELQSGQWGYFNLISTSAWLKNHPETAVRLLKALAQADDYIERHPNEAKAIVQKRLQLDEAYINEVWPQYNFMLSLEQPMILAMEDQARWMISNNMTAEKTVPNFLDYISADALKSADSRAVRIPGK